MSNCLIKSFSRFQIVYDEINHKRNPFLTVERRIVSDSVKEVITEHKTFLDAVKHINILSKEPVNILSLGEVVLMTK